ncbi:MAG: PTS sugar transporter subunit IIC [Erysipelotrichaceae bacterium]|nr:PTS sugar transporter subunit IIC [Erysipelotrichaceae bacterium]
MTFLDRKDVKISARRYGIDALGAMAQGLFASLLIGTILTTIGQLAGLPALEEIGAFASGVKGPAMAAAIGVSLHAPNLVLFSLMAVGAAADSLGGAGGPLAVYVVAVLACEAGKIVSRETRLDILVTPFITICCGVLLSMAFAPAIGSAAMSIGQFIMWAVAQQPLIMGMIVSVLMGIVLTLPISSAAICAALSLTGLAGGAALAGCCAQMVGFAVQSYKVNGIGGLFAQGIGTSMLQMGNIVRKPVIWIPTILTSALTGPIASCIFRLQMNGSPVASGMGTCGLVGQIGVVTGWMNEIAEGSKVSISAFDWTGLILISFVLPAVLTLIFNWICLKKGLYTEEDLKLDI